MAAMLFLVLLVQQINASNISAWICSIPLFEEHWSLSTARSCCYASKTVFTSLSFLYNLRFPLPRLLSWVLTTPSVLAWFLPSILRPLLSCFLLPSSLSASFPLWPVFRLLLSSVYFLFLFFPHSFFIRPLPRPALGRIPASVSYTVPQHKCTPMIHFLYIIL